MDNNFLKVDNVQRYMDLYLDRGEEEINNIDPNLLISEFIDTFINKKLYICNREPLCECKVYCDCNNEEFALIKLKIDIVSNNQCIIEFTLKEQLKLKKEYDWCIFYLEDTNDINIINIDLLDNKLCLLFKEKEKNLTFMLDEKPKNHYKNHYTLNFNYMNFY
jgi:hypothetical protein